MVPHLKYILKKKITYKSLNLICAFKHQRHKEEADRIILSKIFLQIV
jgi:hypothetical protein